VTLEEACTLRNFQPLVVKERVVEDGRTVIKNVNCTFFKMLGEHVVVRVFGNLYVTLTPEEVEKA
jgi:hypothetical protein